MSTIDAGKPDLDVVVVSWNSRKFLEKCIDSVFSSRPGNFRLGKTIIVDNGSTDGSAEEIESRFAAAIVLVRNTRNEGFGKACNIGAALGHAKYILFLNPDAELGRGSLAYAVGFLEDPRNADVGACGLRLVDGHGASARTCARRPTARMFVASAFGIHRFVNSAKLTYVMTDFDHESDKFVDHVMGAMYLVRRSVFERIGGFDQRFFVYLEDLDLSTGIRDLGKSIAFLAAEPVFHEGGGTSKAVLDKRLFYSLHSRLKYAAKHFSLPGTVSVWMSTLFIEPLIRVAVAVTGGRLSEVSHTLRAYRWLYGAVLGITTPLEVAELGKHRRAC